MFCIAALIPSPPVLVPELGGAIARANAADPLAPLRTAVTEAAGALAAVTDLWTVIGSGDADAVLGSAATGTFRGYGVDLPVTLGAAAPAAEPDPRLPLPALIAGWLRAEVAPSARVEARILAAGTPPEVCAERGAALRAELDAAAEPRAVLVVADGAATLSLKAPGYLDERAEGVQRALDRALSAGDRAELLALEPGLCGELGISGRPAYQALAGLFAADGAGPVTDTLYCDSPFGVGYHVGVWRPGGTA